MLLSADGELNERVLSGGIAYDLCRPVDPWGWWFSRAVAQKLVGMLMRGAPMVLLQFLIPAGYRMALPSSWGAGAAFTVSLVAGLAVIAAVDAIRSAVVMRTLDSRGVERHASAADDDLFAGNVIPLTAGVPARVARGLHPLPALCPGPGRAQIRLYLGGGGFLLTLCVQLGWLLALSWLGTGHVAAGAAAGDHTEGGQAWKPCGIWGDAMGLLLRYPPCSTGRPS